jgi:hypothetical protein
MAKLTAAQTMTLRAIASDPEGRVWNSGAHRISTMVALMKAGLVTLEWSACSRYNRRTQRTTYGTECGATLTDAGKIAAASM